MKTNDETTTLAKRARRRALRAAQVVTLGLALSIPGAGCYGEHQLAEVDPIAETAPEADAGEALPDAGPTEPDAGAIADAGPVCDITSADWAECCERANWNTDWGCLAWGPYVPPSDDLAETVRAMQARLATSQAA